MGRRGRACEDWVLCVWHGRPRSRGCCVAWSDATGLEWEVRTQGGSIRYAVSRVCACGAGTSLVEQRGCGGADPGALVGGASWNLRCTTWQVQLGRGACGARKPRCGLMRMRTADLVLCAAAGQGRFRVVKHGYRMLSALRSFSMMEARRASASLLDRTSF